MKIDGWKVSMAILGMVDIVGGVCLLLTVVLFQSFSFISLLGLVYLFFGLIILHGPIDVKWLSYGIIPGTVLSALMIILSNNNDMPTYYKDALDQRIAAISILIGLCLVNYFLCIKYQSRFHLDEK